MLELSKYTKELSKFFSTSDNILLVGHINPDGDSIGSQLALYHYLKSVGRNVTMLSPNNLQEFLRWMDGAELINVYIRNRDKCRNLIRNADLIVMLDFNLTDRLGEAEETFVASAAKKIVIDHHLNPQDFADFIISDPARCSTSEIVYELVTILNGDHFRSKPFAEAIYTGIITDTGNFEHGAYTSRTLRIVAELLDSDVEKELIIDRVYNNFSVERMRLQGFALNEKMVILPEFKTAYIILTMKDLELYNHVKGDTEGFVNMPLSIKGIIFSALFIEKEGFIKLSFRSKGTFPVNEFASENFSGGGHLNASGGEFPGTLENAVGFFLKTLRENFKRFNKDN